MTGFSSGADSQGVLKESTARGRVGGHMTRKQIAELKRNPNMVIVGLSARKLRRIRAKVAK